MRAIPPLIAFLAVTACDPGSSLPPQRSPWDPAPGFWIWNRSSPLTEAASEDLATIGSSCLYWQLSDLGSDPVSINHERLAAIRGSRAIPVIRLPAGARTLADRPIHSALRDWCRILAAEGRDLRVQIDYDCPTASLDAYAMFLHRLRSDAGISFLSVTALASWIDAPDFERVTSAVDELVPMFYDLASDPPEAIMEGKPLPMINNGTQEWISKWRQCPQTWRAGLPNFQRLSLFEPNGTLVGHLQDWEPNAILTHPRLQRLPESSCDTILLRITAPTVVSQVSLRPGQHLVWRLPDEDQTRQALEQAREAGARGVVWFAHPESAPRAWHSVVHLHTMTRGDIPSPAPAIRLSADGSIRLVNQGTGDLPARYHARPWKLILEAAEAGAFGTSGPGTFSSLDAPGTSLAHPEFATKIELSLYSLRIDHIRHTAPRLIVRPEGGPPSWHIDPVP